MNSAAFALDFVVRRMYRHPSCGHHATARPLLRRANARSVRARQNL